MRCFGDGDPLYERYHDLEWGRPITDEPGMLERVCLEAFQSGLSWRVVLGKREGFRAAFKNFDPTVVAGFTDDDVLRLLDDPGVIRNRTKIEAAIANARATVALRASGTDLGDLVWSFRPPPRPAPRSSAEIPALTAESTALAKALKKSGFKFVGPTTAYATMQAAGLVNDHFASCDVRADVAAEQEAAQLNP